tara:strand:+ start:2820 stop:3878 length:1059 start_codon:yes stop_codon:yes gene_type:complete
MVYNILGVNLSHNGSIALVSDGKLILYLEEERLSRFKRDSNPYILLDKYLKKFNINHLVFTGVNTESLNSVKTFEKIFKDFLLNTEITLLFNHHHYNHAFCAFTNSGFKTANNIVLDFGGSYENLSQESESIFYFTQDSLSEKKIYKSYNNFCLSIAGITKTYSSVGLIFGINSQEGGKLMGLSSYGKKNSSLPDFFINGKGNPELFISNIPGKAGFIYNNLWNFGYKEDLSNKKLPSVGKDIAYKIQQDSQKEIAKLVEKSIQFNNCSNVTISGGFGLNCVNNYFLKKKFPNINFYFEPISHDGGTAIGAAYWRWKELNPNFKFKPLKSLYLGPQYSKEQLLEGIKKYVSN